MKSDNLIKEWFLIQSIFILSKETQSIIISISNSYMEVGKIHPLKFYRKMPLTIYLIASIIGVSFCGEVLEPSNLSHELFLKYPDESITELSEQDLSSFNMTKLAQFDDGFGVMHDIVIQGDLAFIAVQWGGLAIFNISNLSNPILLSSYFESSDRISSRDLTSGVFVRDSIVFLADGKNGLLILNVSNPSEPYKISHYSSLGYWDWYKDVFVEHNLAYVLSPEKLFIFNISNLFIPVIIAEQSLVGTVYDIIVNDDLVFVSGIKSQIYNTTNPIAPFLVSFANETNAFVISNDHLLSITDSKRLVIQQLNSLTLIANYSFTIAGTAEFLCTNDHFAYIGSSEEILRVNITNITQPQIDANITEMNWYYSTYPYHVDRTFALTDTSERSDIVFVADYQRGLFIYNSSEISSTALLSHFDCGMRSELITVVDNYIYVVSRVDSPYWPGKLEIFVFDEDTNKLSRLGSYLTIGTIWDIQVVDNFAFLAVLNGIEIIDVSDPSNPVKIVKHHIGAWAIWYDIEYQVLYLCADWSGLYIIDASDFTNLTVISRIDKISSIPFLAYDICIENDVLYVLDGQMFGGFGIIDVSNPFHPKPIDYIVLNRALLNIFVEDNMIYLTGDYPDLLVVDCSDRSNPVIQGQFVNSKLSFHLYFSQGLCFLPQLTTLSIIDLSNNSNPQLLFSIEHTFPCLYKDVYVQGSYVYLTCAWAGIEIWQLPESHQTTDWVKIFLFTTLSLFGFSMILITIVVIRRNKES